MRTTLDLDERVIAMARSRAAAEGTSVGKALSSIVLEARAATAPSAGLPLFPPVEGHVITNELVASHRDDP